MLTLATSALAKRERKVITYGTLALGANITPYLLLVTYYLLLISQYGLPLSIFVGWVKRQHNPTKPDKCWVEEQNPTYFNVDI